MASSKSFERGRITFHKTGHLEPRKAAQFVRGDSDTGKGFNDEPLSCHWGQREWGR
jgi:hypothetical protein